MRHTQLPEIAKSAERWNTWGVTHVRLITVSTSHQCAYCRNNNDTVISVYDMCKHFEHCMQSRGCFCSFQPIFPQKHNEYTT
jgi:hypothetical protein